jgi:hypothetical protein
MGPATQCAAMVYAAISKRHKNENPVQVDRPAEVHYDGGKIVLGETFRVCSLS